MNRPSIERPLPKYVSGTVAAMLLAIFGYSPLPAQPAKEWRVLQVQVSSADGLYSLIAPGSQGIAMRAGVAADVDGQWLCASDYPRHEVSHTETLGYLGAATDWRVVYSGKAGQPDLAYHLRVYSDEPFADIQVTVRNTTAKTIHVEGIRSLNDTEGPILNLGAGLVNYRVLSDSWSEDRPAMAIHNLGDDTDGMQRAVGSQLIYNPENRESLFVGALTSDRFVTVLRLKLSSSLATAPHLFSYEVDSTGTTALQMQNSLSHSPKADQIQLSLPVDPGGELSSEPVLISLSKDYHQQLDTYGSLIRTINHARVSAPPLMGWWSWTAYYFGLNDGAARTNAEWEAEHLKAFGYTIFHIDEGYQYARGEYTTPNATLFPNGLASVYYQVNHLGLTPSIWTAPFEVSDRSWVYRNHPDWLVKNGEGQPIHAGAVVDGKDQLYVLDSTNPGAQEYLAKTYSDLVNLWGIRSIKMDFMDDTAVEGYYYKPNTTALQAQRIGLGIIRRAVGDNVYLDKDGSPMLNPVGIVDYGRISQDTGHTFSASKEAATGIAARYYMNRNYFVADPDAFTVSTQTIKDQTWHESDKPATLDDAQVSIALAAVSGGMFEIGDNLPSLTKEPKRVALIENPDLINMIRLGKASVPLDLMSYSQEDGQPSIFLLKEDGRQSVLTVFNWSDNERMHTIDLGAVGLPSAGRFTVTDILDSADAIPLHGSVLALKQPRHSVRVLKIVDIGAVKMKPNITADVPSLGLTGSVLKFSAATENNEPVLSYRWDFGDGVVCQGGDVDHAYTESGDFDVRLAAEGLDGVTIHVSRHIHISGHLPTTFDPANIRRDQSKK
ncbi:MAG: alpha-galactosidase [Acidobacteriaceae bacterium]